MTTETLIDTASPKPKGDGFFQISLKRITEIAKSGLGPDALAAYIVLAGGVNGHEKLMNRASTHGPQSIHRRTLMSRSPAAVHAVQMLSAKGFISSPLQSGAALSASAKANRSTARWLVDPDSECDLAIGQGFLQQRKKVNHQKTDNQHDHHTYASTLAHLCNTVVNADGIPVANALIDALLVFFHLHEHQDFGKFGGVDPEVAHGRFRPAKSNEEEGSGHVTSLAGVDGWSLVTEHAPHVIVLSELFASKALAGVPSWKDAPPLKVRAAHALEQLRKADLVYQAHVVWDSDPVNKGLGLHPVPLFALYVVASRSSKLELGLQRDVHNALIKTDTYTGVQIYGESRGKLPQWAGKSISQNSIH